MPALLSQWTSQFRSASISITKSTRYALAIMIFGSLFYSCKKNSSNSGGTTPPPPVKSNQHNSLATQHGDNHRTGWNSTESELNTTNVNTGKFGLILSLPVDDQVYSQPLVVGNLQVSGQTHNVLFIATVNNSVYAFDGDDGKLLWNNNFTVSGMRVVQNTDMTGACGGSYADFSGHIGIVGTPVIDTVNKFIYFVARSTSQDGQTYLQQLHKVNIITGQDDIPPVTITASYPGTGDGSQNLVINFNPQKQNQRAALTLSNGNVIITWSSHCDWGPYHGWVIGYDAAGLNRQFVFNATPNDENGGIWESGQGLSVDDQGNLYIATGNGSIFYGGGDGTDYGESAVKLVVNGNSISVGSFFTPYNALFLNQNDLDFGSLGSLLIPHSNYFFTGAKDGSLFLLDKDNMGGYDSTANHVYQELNLGNPDANEHCQAAYFESANAGFVTLWSENDPLRVYPFVNNKLGNPVKSTIAGPVGQNGAMLSISSNGQNEGIIWATHAVAPGDAEHTVSNGILRAINAKNITQELWNSNLSPSDQLGKYAKFATPTIVNGHVYVATFSNKVQVYGLK